MINFGDLPVFDATAYPMIFIFRKQSPEKAHDFQALKVNDIEAIDFLREEIRQKAWTQSQEGLVTHSWSLLYPKNLAVLSKLRGIKPTLSTYVGGEIYFGVKTGLNEAFVIDHQTRSYLLNEHSQSSEIIKPWLRGRDIKRWRLEYDELYIIFTYHGINIKNYPAVEEYLASYRQALENRATASHHAWYELQQPQMGIYPKFDQPKILYQEIATYQAFTFTGRTADKRGHKPQV